jgi:hypothetical protein
VWRLRTDGSITSAERDRLVAPLNRALGQIDAGQKNAAINSLTAFRNDVRAFQRSGVLTPAQAQPLLDRVQALIAELR